MNTPAELHRLMTVAEVAEFMNVSAVTIYRLASRGEIPARKVGKLWRFRRMDIEAYLSRPNKRLSCSAPALEVSDHP